MRKQEADAIKEEFIGDLDHKDALDNDAIDHRRRERMVKQFMEGGSMQGISARDAINGLQLEPGVARSPTPSLEFPDHNKVFHLKPSS